MTNFIAPLTAPDLTLAQAGGKGANLQKLLAGGFPTPSGFVVTTDAYRAFVRANALDHVLAGANVEDAESIERASQAIRQQFEQAALPAEIAEAIAAGYAALPPSTAVAVRSSATAEDLPEASFAGQQDTYLNIQGVEAVLKAVQRCWGSLWTGRAIAYRAHQSIPSESVALAVVVQPMLPATAAGVLFTLNPVTGNRDEIILNATWGLGEALVAGQVNPDTLVVDKATGRIKSLELGDKALMTAPTATGTAEVEVDAAHRAQAVLTPAQAAELAQLGRAIEAHFGGPQDIEWAIADGRAYILQSRPVTTLPRGAAGQGHVPGDDAWPPLITDAPQPYDIWSQADVGERWPDPVTPLTWSLWCSMMNENFWATLEALPSPMPRQAQWAKRAYGRIYMNEGALAHVYQQEMGMPASRVAEGLGAQGMEAKPKEGWNWGLVLRRAPVLLKMMGDMQRHIKLYEAAFPQIDAWVEAFMRRDLTPVSDADLWAENRLWRQRGMEHMTYHGSVTGLSMSNFPMLENLMQSWLGDKTLAHTLITGLTGIMQAELVPAFRGLAQALRTAGLAGLVLENEPSAALAQLRVTPAAAPFLQQLDAFLQRHGHRCATEAEMMRPRWIEAPELVIEALVPYLRNDNPKLAEAEAQQRQQRERAEARVNARLDPLRRAYFRSLLKQVQHQVRMRDNGQGYLVKLLLPWRHIFGVLAERWASRGWLATAEDFFFLVTEDIEAVLAANDPARAGLDLRALVRERRRAYDYWFTVTAPEVLDRAGRPLSPVASGSTAGENFLAGIAASAGKITGRARLIPSPREMGRLQPGEILVTRATDPGWTPVFSTISGVVLEVGGLLSHGAIVAREYGLPAVVNVPEATRRIADGQTITVDGAAGRVYLE